MNENEEVVINSSTSLLIETLEKRWRTYRSELKRCRKEPTEEAIHDLRVAARRLLALVDMLRASSPHPRLQKLRRAFKNQLDDFDDLRDTQVMLVEVSETLVDLPELAPFQEYLTKRERRLLRSTAKAIKSFKYASVRKRVGAARKSLLKPADEEDRKMKLLHTVDDAYAAALRRHKRIELAQPTTIHRVRVAFKKFRYMVEIIYPLVPNFPVDYLKHMHDYQGLMGDIQDMEIFLATFEEFAEKDASYDPEPARRHYQQHQADVVNAFVEDMQQINTFWRLEPEFPFPWESKQRRKKATSSKKLTGPLPEQEKDGNGEQAEAEKEEKK